MENCQECKRLMGKLDWLGLHLLSVQVGEGGFWRMSWEDDKGKAQITEIRAQPHSTESYGEILLKLIDKAQP